MSNEILKNDNSISLDWGNVTGASKYWLQVSKDYIDFRATLEYEDNNLATSDDTFTTSGNGTYYWRWRPYISGAWQPWREVNSFIVNTGASTDVSATSWMFINKNDVTDTYILELQPIRWRLTDNHIWEARRRNRKGKIRSQKFVTKAVLSLDVTRSYWGDNQKAEMLRFYNLAQAFYVAVRYDNQPETDYVYRCWEVMFASAPNLDIPGGNTLELEEV
jgi:hypothetical protein